MKLDENISKIIANHILGKTTSEEDEVLQDWLTDPYNELVFKKITDQKRIGDELAQLDAVDSEKSYKVFKKKTSQTIKWQRVLGYAASILLPLAIGVSIVVFTNKDFDEQEIAELTRFDSDNISILAEDGQLYTLKGNDTIVNTSHAQFVVKGDSIGYESKSVNLPEKLIYNTINVPAGKRSTFKLSDGTLVHLNAGTTLKYPTNFIGDKRRVELISGEAYFDVQKDSKPFVLDFGVNKIKVLGTKFNVKAYDEDEKEFVTLEEGSIALDNSKNEIKLLPNQQAVINKQDLSLDIGTVDASIYSYWRSGFMNYKEEKLSAILNDLQRQYNIKLFYQNQDVKNKRLSISLNTNKEFATILRAIEATGGVTFEINNSVVIVKK
ncbi:MAG: FecR domain-containing protein [Labilibaculum sp.]|nr:FecR family protein [Labilibaculum sp.]MBI9058293.1 FecR domain-containing protein [Labilibaculum sp.]